MVWLRMSLTDNKRLARGYLAAFATLLMWSGFSLFSRMAGKSVLTPYDVYALRLITASLFLLPFVGHLPPAAWKDQRLWILTCLCSLIYCPFVYIGFKYAPAAHGGILISGLQALLVGLLLWVTEGRRPKGRRLLGLACIAGGITCAAVPHFFDGSPETAFGDLLILAGSVLWALYTLLASRWRYPPMALTCAIVFGSSVVYLPIYFLWLPKQMDAAPMLLIVSQGVFQGLFTTIFAMLTYLKAMALLGTERTTALLSLVPIVIGLSAVPLLDEPLTSWLLCGLVLVSSGAWLASRRSG